MLSSLFRINIGVIECTMVENNLTEAPFFATPCLLGPQGVEEVLPFGNKIRLFLFFHQIFFFVEVLNNFCLYMLNIIFIFFPGKLSPFEQEGLNAMVPDLVGQAKKGVAYVKSA